ncbi:hypothetical protein [Streptomyces sp. ERV7]|uniref:hypothetical protein n=1 Tax=Streptomyces sp. ERV7 TaxID=1322334 RepID=UPI00131BB3D6|nr:hypothetical protein [Streptomyces sp. ERV7]
MAHSYSVSPTFSEGRKMINGQDLVRISISLARVVDGDQGKDREKQQDSFPLTPLIDELQTSSAARKVFSVSH